MPDDDLVVELPSEPSTQEPKKEEKTVETKTEVNPVEDLKAQLEAMKAATEQDRTQRETLQAEARRHAEEAERARTELASTKTALTESNVSVLDNAIAAAEGEAAGYQRDQQAAFEANDFAKAAEMGRKMAKAEARVAQLEAGKADLEYRNKAEAEKPKEEKTATPKVQPDPFEAAVSNLTPKTAKWMRDQKTAGRDYMTDPRMSSKAASAHYAAVGEGYVPDTDAYFEFCETHLGLRKTDDPEPKNNGGAVRERTKKMEAAPVTRDSTPAGGQLSTTKVTLTPGEQKAATDGTVVWNYNDDKIGAKKGAPVGLKEYARRKQAMQTEGRYGVMVDS